MTDTEKYFAGCLAAAVSGRKSSDFPDWVNAEQFKSLALSHGVAGAVYYAVKDARGTPETLLSELREEHEKALEADRLRETEEERVFAAFEKAGISFLPIQGSVLCLYYPERDMRAVTDTDVIVKRSARKGAREALKSCGYALSKKNDGSDVYRSADGSVFEVRYEPKDKSAFHRKLTERAVPLEDGGARLSLNHSDFYIYMISGLAEKLRTADVTLKHFADVKVFYSRCGDRLDGDYVAKTLAEMGLDTFESAVKELLYTLFYGAEASDGTKELLGYVFSCCAGGARGKNKRIVKSLGLADVGGGKARMTAGDAAIALFTIVLLSFAICLIGFTFFVKEKPRDIAAAEPADSTEDAVSAESTDEESVYTLPEQDYATIPYKSGVYSGYISDGLPNGTGELNLPNGEKYIGSFADGEFNGPGVYHYLDGSSYDGMWFEGAIYGYGTLTFADNSYIYANFVDGEPQGSCIYQNAEGDVYEGELKDGKRTGKGRFLWANGDRYEGNYVDGEREGSGKYTYANGDSYEGEWIASVPNGKGVMIVGGVKYEGLFVQGIIEGEGVSVTASGDKYEGFFIGGKCCDDSAVYTFKDGSKYEGAFENGLFNGKGKFTYTDGDTVEGTFENGVLQGTAIYYDKSAGSTRTVTYKDGKPA